GKEFALLEVDDHAAVEVQQRDERYDSPAQCRRRTEQLAEGQLTTLGHDAFDLLRALLDRVALARRDHIVLTSARRKREHARPCGGEGGDLAPARWNAEGRAAFAVERSLAAAQPVAERACSLTHDRVLHEPRAQLFLRLAFLLFGDRRDRRQEAARFQQHKTRRQREERRDLVGRQLRERVDTSEIPIGKIAQTNRQDVELRLLDEPRRDAMPETRIGRLRPVVKEARGHEFRIRATCEEDLRRALGVPLVPTLGREVPPGLHDAIDGAHPIKNRTIARAGAKTTALRICGANRSTARSRNGPYC